MDVHPGPLGNPPPCVLLCTKRSGGITGRDKPADVAACSEALPDKKENLIWEFRSQSEIKAVLLLQPISRQALHLKSLAEKSHLLRSSELPKGFGLI